MVRPVSPFVVQMKARLEALNLQLHLGSKELADRLESGKVALMNDLRDIRAKVSENSSAAARKLSERLKHLEEQSHVARAEGREALEAQRKQLSDTLDEAREAAAAWAEEAREEFREERLEIAELLETWRMQFDLFRLQIRLGAKDAKDEWGRYKEKISERIADIERKLDEATDGSRDTGHRFRTEMESAWQHVKAAFGKS